MSYIPHSPPGGRTQFVMLERSGDNPEGTVFKFECFPWGMPWEVETATLHLSQGIRVWWKWGGV